MKYTNRADLLIAAGESIKMQEADLAVPIYKFNGMKCGVNLSYFFDISQDYEFPLAVVEGKPVFVGDELYTMSGDRGVVLEVSTANYIALKNNAFTYHRNTDGVSWNPPKPKTVMVELLREDAEWWINEDFCSDRQVRVQAACRKALEK